MAATIRGREAAGKLGKRLFSSSAAVARPFLVPPSAFRSGRRGVQTSTYDKNLDEQDCPAVVPDHAIDSRASDKYWGPHPTTGIFGPSSDQNFAAGGSVGKPADGTSTVLDQKVWFRPQEDVEKPPHN